MEVLQTLARKNHVLALKLLLTYDRLSRRPNETIDPFKKSGIVASKATYAYKISRGEKGFDVECSYGFLIKRMNFSKCFHALVIKSHSSSPKEIRYEFKSSENESFSRTVPCLPLIMHSRKKDIYKNFAYAEIPFRGFSFSGRITELTVNFKLENAFNPRHQKTFILCPFIYTKRVDEAEILLDFSQIDAANVPRSVALRCYPYNGCPCSSATTQGLVNEGGTFGTTVKPAISKAVYILEIQRPMLNK